MSPRRVPHPPVLPLTLAVVVAAAIYESALALSWIATRPVSERPAQWIVVVVGIVAIVVQTIVFAFASGRDSLRAAALVPTIPLAAAWLLIARFQSFDPYYLPTLRRISDHGLLNPNLVWTLVLLALLASGISVFRRPIGMAISAPLLLVIALTTWLASTGH
jgi:hypothetical protein